MKIIGFSAVETGEHSGKDTAAEYAIEWAERDFYSAKRQGFADLLKLSGMRALGLPEDFTLKEALTYANALKDGGSITVTIPNAALKAAGATEYQLGGPETYTFSGREFWRWYGTEAHRNVFGTDFWVDALLKPYEYKPEYEDHYPGKLINPDRRPDFLIIPDVRFPNEAEAINRLDGIVVDIHRPGEINSGTGHVSEAGFSDEFITCSIQNDAGLPKLRAAVFDTLDALLVR